MRVRMSMMTTLRRRSGGRGGPAYALGIGLAPWLVSSLGVMVFAAGMAAFGQAGAAQTPAAPTVAAEDGAVVAAEKLVGKSLFLRGFYAANELRYDAAGTVQGAGNLTTGDWTLAGVNVL